MTQPDLTYEELTVAEETLFEEVRRLKGEMARVKQDLEIAKGAADTLFNLNINPYSQFAKLQGVEFGRNFFRGEQGFLQVATGDIGTPGALAELISLYWLNTLANDPSTVTPYVKLGAIVDPDDTDFTSGVAAARWEAFRDSTHYHRIRFFQGVKGGPEANGLRLELQAATGSATGPQLWLTQFEDDSGRDVRINNAPLYLVGVTADWGLLQDGMLWYRSDTDKFRARINGATENLATETYVDAAGGGGMDLIVQEADQAIQSETGLQNTELLFAVAANEVFQFEGVIVWDTPAAADIKFAATGPTGAVGAFAARVEVASTPEAAAELGTAVPFLIVSAARQYARFYGAIHNGANAGNLTIQFAQNTSTASNTTVHAGSYLKWQAES